MDRCRLLNDDLKRRVFSWVLQFQEAETREYWIQIQEWAISCSARFLHYDMKSHLKQLHNAYVHYIMYMNIANLNEFEIRQNNILYGISFVRFIKIRNRLGRAHYDRNISSTNII